MAKLRVSADCEQDVLNYRRLGFSLNKSDWREMSVNELLGMLGNPDLEYKFAKEEEDELLNLNDTNWNLLSTTLNLKGSRAEAVKSLLPLKKGALKKNPAKVVKDKVASTAKTVKESVL